MTQAASNEDTTVTTSTVMSTTESSTTNTGTADKYDRQLRLWGSRGQYHVSHTCLVAVHVTAVATETIKNCILPGIQHVHIIDLSNDEPEDVMNQEYASNFFLTSATTATTRAAMALQHLLELNPDVTGSHETYETTHDHHNSTNLFATADENSYNRFQLKLQELQSVYEHVIVLGSDIDRTTIQDMLRSISSLSNDIPFLTVHSYGLMGILQIQYLPLHPIMNPSGGGGGGQNNQQIAGTVPDLRLSHPFPLLKDYMESFIETHFTSGEGTTLALSTHEYGNIPYPILLYHTYHTIWKRQYPSIAKPTTMEQKLEFQRLIQHHYHETTSTTTTNRNDLPVNVQEAIQNSYLAYTERMVDRLHLQSLLSKMTLHQQRTAPRAMNRECVKFFMVLQAIDKFMSRPTESSSSTPPPPVHGTIPDMTASTNAYMELQSIYKQQCLMDTSLIRTYLQPPPFGGDSIAVDLKNSHTWMDDDYIRTFCFNLHQINVMSCHRNHEYSAAHHDTEPREHDDDHDDDPELSMMLDEYTDNDVNEDVQIPLLWYICYEAAQSFHQNAHRYPGEIDPSHIEQEPELLRQDAKQLQGYILQILQDDPKYTGLATHPVIQRTLFQPYHYPTTNPEEVVDENPETRTPMTVDNTMDDPPDGGGAASSKYAVEMVRYGNAQVHVVASIMGGVAAQEMIKIITHQYVPLDNTHVYNGITSTGAVYRL